MRIYLQNETDFTKNGLGYLTDVINAEVVEELNGEYYLSFEYLLYGVLSEYLVQENIVKCRVEDGSYQLFRIKRVIKDFTKIEVYATHIFYDLLNNFLLDTAPTNLNGASFGSWILNHTNYATDFIFQSDINNTKSARYVRRNPIEAIMGDIDNSMVNLFGGDIERDNFTIKLLTHRGSTNGIKLLFGKNIREIKITSDYSSIITRVLPLGFDGLMLPEVYVDSANINNYITPKVAKIEFQNIKYDPDDEDAYQTLEDAYTALRNAVNELYAQGLDLPQVNIKIDWIELSKTNEYQNYQNLETLHLGDDVIAQILGINYSTRVVKIVYNPLVDMIENFEIGTIQSNIGTSINLNTQRVEEINPTSILQSAKDNATSQINNAMGGYVYKTTTDLYIMDTNDPSTATRVWRWNLNGLGYSDTGINGTYELAMTQDGSIVADFITAGTMSVDRIEGLQQLFIDIQSLEDNFDSEGNAKSVITTEGFSFNNDGLNISNSNTDFNTTIDETGTFYRDGETIISQTTKDNVITRDLVLYGKYYYGVAEDLDVANFTKEDAMFVGELYTDNNDETGFGHFANQ